mmetsp:Transcript_59947/g.107900  ORF Transcript_59947/g.107900 Transcript_59947/m.107900 type:complete len:88 (+) Transcript_59947:607-870(+)
MVASCPMLMPGARAGADQQGEASPPMSARPAAVAQLRLDMAVIRGQPAIRSPLQAEAVQQLAHHVGGPMHGTIISTVAVARAFRAKR